MNVENVKRAIEVLKNTDKEYTSGQLVHNGCYCALGVIGSECLGMSDEELERSSYDEMDGFLGIDTMFIWEANDSSDDKTFDDAIAALETRLANHEERLNSRT